jgi:glycerophosphoryl diester phosphodiesterase
LTQVIGHRGASAVAPENTVEAFRTAVELGADGVELDVRRAAHGHLAVNHDELLPDGRPVRELPRPDWPESLCELSAALDACAGLATVNVEVKNWPADGDFDEELAIAEAVVEVLLARPADEQGAFLVSCFHLPTLDRVRALAPGLATAWLTIGFADVAEDLARVAGGGHTAVHPHHGAVDEDVVRQAHDAGLRVNTWTCDVPDRIAWLAATGVDGVVTNDVEAALEALGRR